MPRRKTRPTPESRILLRAPRAADLAEWVDLSRRSRSLLKPSTPTPRSGVDPFGPAAFRRLLKDSDTPATRRFLICLSRDGTIVGQISFTGISRGPFQSCYVGYWIGKGFGGRGLMTEALAAAIRFAFLKLSLHRIEANIMPENARSRSLVARLGFRKEGLGRRLLHIAGRWRDHERWALTIEEWSKGKPPRD